MSGVVLDTSLTLAMTMPDERTDPFAELAHSVVAGGAVVPSLWRIEVANAYLNAVRRRRMTKETRAELIRNLDILAIEIDPMTDTLAFSALSELAQRHGLTIYDAAYLELALRKGLPLATLDGDLRKAATAEGLELLPA